MQQLTIVVIRKGLRPLAFQSRPPIGPKSHMAVRRTPFCIEGKSDKGSIVAVGRAVLKSELKYL